MLAQDSTPKYLVLQVLKLTSHGDMADGRSLRLRSHATGQTPATMSELPAIAPHSSSAIYAVGEFLIAIFFGVLEVVFFWQNVSHV